MSSRRGKGVTSVGNKTTKEWTKKGQVASQEVSTPTSVAGASHVDMIAILDQNATKAQLPAIPKTKPTRQRKSHAAPPFSVEQMKDQCLQSGILSQPLTPLQTNVMGNIRIGIANCWAMSPNFQDFL
ncbi:unnamed protein product [Calypogeia fissa]